MGSMCQSRTPAASARLQVVSYPPPPPVPYTGKPGRRRGRTAVWVGAVLFVVGLALLLVGALVGFGNSLGKVDGFQRVSLEQGSATLTFEAGSYVGYYEAPSLTNGATVDLSIHDASTGAPIQIGRYGTRLTYSYHGHHGVAVFQFRIPRTGRYDVRFTAADPDLAAGSSIAFGPSITRAIVGGVLTVVAGGLVLAAGLITLIVGLVLGRRRRSWPTAGGTYPGYPSGYPQQYPPQPYPQQPYPQQQPPTPQQQQGDPQPPADPWPPG